MAFIPSSTLGSINANLGEFVLGVIEQADISFSCAGNSSASFGGRLLARGQFTASGRSSARYTQGFLPYRLPVRRGQRFVKPRFPARLDPGSPLVRGMAIATLADDAGGTGRTYDTGSSTSSTGLDSINLVGHDHGVLQANGAGSYSHERDVWGMHYQGPTGSGPTYRYDFGASSFLTFPDALSVTVFAKGTATDPAATGAVAVGKISTTYTVYDWQLLSLSTGTQWRFMVNTSAGIKDLIVSGVGGTSVPDLVTATYDGVTMCLYVNGVLAGSLAANSPMVTNSACHVLLMGDYATDAGIGTDRQFRNSMYAAYVWSRALSPAEVAQIYLDPYWFAVQKPQRLGVADAGTPPSVKTGAFTLAGSSAARWAGNIRAGGAFRSTGKSASSWTSFTQRLGSFASAGKGNAGWASPTQWLGDFQGDGKSTTLWIPATGFGSTSFLCNGVATADWLGSLALDGLFACDGIARVRWEAAGPPLLGSFQCDGVGTVFFLVGLDGVIYTCLTGGDDGTVQHYPNFVY